MSLLAEVVIDSPDVLIVVYGFLLVREKVVLAGQVRRRIQRQKLLGHRIPTVRWNHISGKRIADVGDAVRPETRGGRVVDRTGELPVPLRQRRHVGQLRRGIHFARALPREKEEGLVLDDRPAHRGAVLILDELRCLPGWLKVRLGIESGVAQKLE